MCRILILDDEKFVAETLKQTLETRSTNTADAVFHLEDAISKTLYALQTGKPYDVLLIDQVLGAGKDGIRLWRNCANSARILMQLF